MSKNSKKQDNKEKNNVVNFPQGSKKGALDGASLREEYEAENSNDEIEDITDEIAEYVLNSLFEKSGKDLSYVEALLGLNKAYLQVLLQLVEDSDYDVDEFLNYFYAEGDRISNKYIEEQNFEVDPVKAAGSLALASSYLLSILDEEE